jgi:hypothetical protein
MSTPGPQLGGIVQCCVMLRVKLTGYRSRPNEHIKPGTVGWLEPLEMSVDGDVVTGRFYPMHDGAPKGFGLVIWPLFESIAALEPSPFAAPV